MISKDEELELRKQLIAVTEELDESRQKIVMMQRALGKIKKTCMSAGVPPGTAVVMVERLVQRVRGR